jgi:coatomer subunit gamma
LVPAQVLENVRMELGLAELEDVEIRESLGMTLKRMPHNSAGSVFVVLEREEGSLSRGPVTTTMKFLVKEADIATGEVEEDGYEDEYALEDLEVLPPHTYWALVCAADVFDLAN